MSVDAYLAGAQLRALGRMRARAKIWRPVPPEELSVDTATLDLVGGDLEDGDPRLDVVIPSTPCRISSRTATVMSRDAEGLSLAVQDVVLSLPISGSELVRVGDVVEIIDGGPSLAMTGRRYTVTGLPEQTDASAARFPVEHATEEA